MNDFITINIPHKTHTTMKNTIALLALFLSITAVSAQQKIFVLDHNGATSIHANLDTALHHAQNGDVIYLPGGVIGSAEFSGNINKSVSRIGAGIHPDSSAATSQTIITTNLAIRVNDVSMTGIVMNRSTSILKASNIYIERCFFNQPSGEWTLFFMDDSCRNIIVHSSIFNNEFRSTNKVSGVVVSNSLFLGVDRFLFAHNAQFKNCIFRSAIKMATSGFFGSLEHCLIENSIIHSDYSNHYTGTTTTIFNNNIYIYTGTPKAVSAHNLQFNQNITDVFANPITWEAFDNYHLKHPTSPAIGAGLGGTDCGIYGGDKPFKEGAVPFNPHIRQIDIPTTTNQNGNLNINLRVGAQSH
jgi:hypothetical protein